MEEKDDPDSHKKAMKPLVGSKILGYKNGVSQGVMFENIYDGVYHPAISLYMGAKVWEGFGGAERAETETPNT